MKGVDSDTKYDIVRAYLKGKKYKDIQEEFGINRWNIQDALSKIGVKTDRIKSHPRLPGSEKKVPGRLMDRYHDGDFLPPMKVNKNNPVLNEDDLDYMERYNLETYDTGEQGSYEMVIDNDGKVRCEKNVHQ